MTTHLWMGGATGVYQRVGPGRAAGFTLLELMITVAVVAILSAIAYPSYQNSVTKTRRGAATSCLLESAQFMERYYTTNLTYVVASLPPLGCNADMAAHYTFSFNGNPTATTYSVQATPIGGQAARDTKCAAVRLDQKGTKTITGTGTVNDCW